VARAGSSADYFVEFEHLLALRVGSLASCHLDFREESRKSVNSSERLGRPRPFAVAFGMDDEDDEADEAPGLVYTLAVDE